MDSSLRFAIVRAVNNAKRNPAVPAPTTVRRLLRGRVTDWTPCGLAILVLFLLPGFLSGCYSFTGTSLPGHVSTVGIPNVINSTLEPGIEQEMTAGITDEFLRDGRLKIASPSTSDARLDAEITAYENRVNDYSSDQNPIDYIVVLTLKVELIDQVKNQELWRDDRLVVTEVYDPSGGETEESARVEIISTLASDIVARTLEQW